jgi:hypothetical protein
VDAIEAAAAEVQCRIWTPVIFPGLRVPDTEFAAGFVTDAGVRRLDPALVAFPRRRRVWLLCRAREGVGVVVRFGVAEVEEAEAGGLVAAGDEVLGSVD